MDCFCRAFNLVVLHFTPIIQDSQHTMPFAVGPRISFHGPQVAARKLYLPWKTLAKAEDPR